MSEHGPGPCSPGAATRLQRWWLAEERHTTWWKLVIQVAMNLKNKEVGACCLDSLSMCFGTLHYFTQQPATWATLCIPVTRICMKAPAEL